MARLKAIEDDEMPALSEIVVPPPPSIILGNDKAIHSIVNQSYLNVWEGSVRSSKTLTSELAWIAYLNDAPPGKFIMSGKSQGSLYRNVISGEFGLLALLQDAAKLHTDRFNNKILTITTKTGIHDCYLFGANDIRSFELMHGMSAVGWYADEIDVHDRLFVNEGFMRTVASRCRKHFWTLNPGNPNAFVYTDYMDVYEDSPPGGGYNRWFFTLDDNPAIDEERKAEIKSQYSGIFYRRYILGERCVAEGAIYDMLDEANYYDDSERPQGLEYISDRLVGIDFGTNNPTCFLDIYDDGTTLWVDREYYHNSRFKDKHGQNVQKDTAQYTDDFLRWVEGEEFDGREFTPGNMTLADFTPRIFADPAASPLITAMRNRGITVTLANNDVLDGISCVATLIRKRLIRIHNTRCPMLKKELGAYAWDEKSSKLGKEQPMKMNDHTPDALKYACFTSLAKWRYASDY